jgi:hypothetical protein
MAPLRFIVVGQEWAPAVTFWKTTPAIPRSA